MERDEAIRRAKVFWSEAPEANEDRKSPNEEEFGSSDTRLDGFLEAVVYPILPEIRTYLKVLVEDAKKELFEIALEEIRRSNVVGKERLKAFLLVEDLFDGAAPCARAALLVLTVPRSVEEEGYLTSVLDDATEDLGELFLASGREDPTGSV